jgi:NitT/TauT family transport system substrate-binding protein
MKKTIILIAILILIGIGVYFIKINTKKEKLYDEIKVAEVTHSPFYTPFYIAIKKGYFEENNININLVLTSGANNAVAAVLSGDAEIGLCGPEATIYVYNEGEKDYVKTFAGLTKRDGQFIVSRVKNENFKLSDLSGKEVLGGRKGGMPIINFYNALKKANISNVKVNDTVDFANLTSAFISGTGDYVNLFEPNATKLEKLGYGYVVSSIGSLSDEVPYTAFNAKKSYLENNKEIINNFRDALNKGLEYTKNNNEKILAEDILEYFPDTSLNDLQTIIKRYKDADSWLNNTTINEKIFTNLEQMLIDNKLITNYVPYNDLITNE